MAGRTERLGRIMAHVHTFFKFSQNFKQPLAIRLKQFLLHNEDVAHIHLAAMEKVLPGGVIVFRKALLNDFQHDVQIFRMQFAAVCFILVIDGLTIHLVQIYRDHGHQIILRDQILNDGGI